jgi:hypothetical protein
MPLVLALHAASPLGRGGAGADDAAVDAAVEAHLRLAMGH